MQHYVVIEGLIGAGKTSLCSILCAEWGARAVLEPSEHNPFLELFYRDPEQYALPVQLFYLMARWRQQEEIRQGDLFSGVVVSDYLFAKDRLFAEATLSDDELEMYDRFAGVLGEIAPVPDLLVWLDAPTPVLLQRIAERRAPGESAIKAPYLDGLRTRYRRLLASWTKCPILEIPNHDMDYVRDAQRRAEVLQRIEEALEGANDPGAPGSASDREAQPNLFGAGST